MPRERKKEGKLYKLFKERGIDPMSLVGDGKCLFKHKQTIYKHLNGDRIPDLRSLMIYSKALNISPIELYELITTHNPCTRKASNHKG